MNALKNIILAASFLLIASLRGQTNTQPSLTVVPVGTPTITSEKTVNGTTYVATFNAQLTAVNADITLAMPATVYPAVSPASVTIYKNGVAETATAVYMISVSYTAPTGLPVVANEFTVPKGAMVNFKTTVTFHPNSGTTSATYGMKLNKIFWLTGLGRSSTELSADGWSTAGAPVIAKQPVPLTTVPPEIAALSDMPSLISMVSKAARRVQVSVWSPKQESSQPSQSVMINGYGTSTNINAAVESVSIPIKLLDMGADVQFNVDVFNAANEVIMSGGESKKPIPAKASWELPRFKPALYIHGDALVGIKDTQNAKHTAPDGSVKYLETKWGQGFMFPSWAVGQGLLEITTTAGVTTTYNLANKTVVKSETLQARSGAAKAYTESISDKTELMLIPETFNGGYGHNVLGEVHVSRGTINLTVTAVTEEMGKATAVRYKKVYPNEVAEQTVSASNGIAVLPALDAGDWEVVGVFPENVLRPWPVSYNNK